VNVGVVKEAIYREKRYTVWNYRYLVDMEFNLGYEWRRGCFSRCNFFI